MRPWPRSCGPMVSAGRRGKASTPTPLAATSEPSSAWAVDSDGAGVAAVWDAGQLTTDPYGTHATKGEVGLTLSYYWQLGFVRTDSFKRIKLRLLTAMPGQLISGPAGAGKSRAAREALAASRPSGRGD